jgi:AcrR family transcriptional regulator
MPTVNAVALRSDAVRNRHLLIDGARTVFGERGLTAPLDEIARRAGVGNATLYRHFPTRCTLVAAVFADTLRDILTETEHALAHPDPWTAFCEHLTYLFRLQATDRALADLLTAGIHGAPELETLRDRAHHGLVRLIDAAQSAGVLRADFRHEDVVLLLMANAGLIERSDSTAPTAWRRHLGYVLDGLHAPARSVNVPSPGEAAVLAAMADLDTRFGCQ